MIYLDHHATTPVDPRVVQAMLPWLTEHFANAGSTTHEAGRWVGHKTSEAIAAIASQLGAQPEELVITSGATESNNLAILGACLHPRQKRRKVISVITEHRAVIDPIQRLATHGFEIQWLPIHPSTDARWGQIILEEARKQIDDQTALVSVMLANNEVGVIQPIAELADHCRSVGALLHTDAAQCLGRMPIDVQSLGVDLLSFSGHKVYAPKGIGGLFVRQRPRLVRLLPQVIGGGQQFNLRSGTLNTPGIHALRAAMELGNQELVSDTARMEQLSGRLHQLLQQGIDSLALNGPDPRRAPRLIGNLNLLFPGVEGQSLMLRCPDLACSSGSACTSAQPRPSHVLTALGLDDDQARCCLRLGIGRTNSIEEIEQAAQWLIDAYRSLRS
jgi:cysteine desulfurase